MNTTSTKLWNNWTLIYPDGYKCFSNGQEYILTDETFEHQAVVRVYEDSLSIFKPVFEASYNVNAKKRTLTIEPVEEYHSLL